MSRALRENDCGMVSFHSGWSSDFDESGVSIAHQDGAVLDSIPTSRPVTNSYESVDSNGRPSWWSWFNRLPVSRRKH